MVFYKGYLIVGEALKLHADWWRSQGCVYTNSPEGTIHVKQLEGVIFESKKAAEAHGLELCKKWVNENLVASDDV
jgi:hypothetical protein